MSTVAFVGIPSRYVPSLRGLLEKYKAEFGEWNFYLIPRDAKEPGLLLRDVGEIEKAAERSTSLHVYGWAAPTGTSKVAGDYFRQFFRFRWFPTYLLAHISRPDQAELVTALKESLREEEEWSSHVKPVDLRSPLLLPASCFRCGAGNRELWRHASSYGNMENITGAEKAVENFTRTHFRRVIASGVQQSKWVDDADLIFEESGERHALAPPPRSWKFSFRITDGFHYDVTHQHARRFALMNANGTSKTAKAGEHLNVDPHGYIRQ